MLSEVTIDSIIAEHVKKPGGIIEAYHAIQKEFNYIPENAIRKAAKQFKLSEAEAFGVATFYSYLSVEPRGRYIIRMCESAPCHIAGADEIIREFEQRLEIKVGETTADGKFTLELTECVGQCQGTPVVTINSEPYVGITREQVPTILELCR